MYDSAQAPCHKHGSQMTTCRSSFLLEMSSGCQVLILPSPSHLPSWIMVVWLLAFLNQSNNCQSQYAGGCFKAERKGREGLFTGRETAAFLWLSWPPPQGPRCCFSQGLNFTLVRDSPSLLFFTILSPEGSLHRFGGVRE